MDSQLLYAINPTIVFLEQPYELQKEKPKNLKTLLDYCKKEGKPIIFRELEDRPDNFLDYAIKTDQNLDGLAFPETSKVLLGGSHFKLIKYDSKTNKIFAEACVPNTSIELYQKFKVEKSRILVLDDLMISLGDEEGLVALSKHKLFKFDSIITDPSNSKTTYHFYKSTAIYSPL